MGGFVENNQKSITKNNNIPRTKISTKKQNQKKELRILIACSRSGHKRYLNYPEYNIKTPEELNARINELIDLISK